MYENMDKNAIREAILANYGGSVSKIEGSFAADMAAAASVEMAKIYATIDYAMQTFLLQTNEGEYLELRAAEYGIIYYCYRCGWNEHTGRHKDAYHGWAYVCHRRRGYYCGR